jgi:hypothetical protein
MRYSLPYFLKQHQLIYICKAKRGVFFEVWTEFLNSYLGEVQPSQGLMSEFEVLIESSVTLLNFCFCSTFQLYLLHFRTPSPTYLCQKDKRALPGDLRSLKL